MNTAITLALELLAAAPMVAKDLKQDAQAWHDAHAWTAKTAAAAASAFALDVTTVGSSPGRSLFAQSGGLAEAIAGSRVMSVSSFFTFSPPR